MPYTILHISDLHRSPEDPISNEVLMASLVSDFARSHQEDSPIHEPDAIVVSGDLIQGVPLFASDHAGSISGQYDVALELLNELTDRFLAGDRTRLVVVPGNHDVDWNVAHSAMLPIADDDLPQNLRPSDFGPATMLRWDWKERKAHQIVNQDVYRERLGHFRRFVGRFYDGAALRYPLDPDREYSLFELNHGRIGVAALNSCDGNDCFAFHGAIAEDALAQAYMDLHDRGPQYDLMMAVWHHNVDGPPGASDYMDVATVHTLIGRGFRLGLHGHQHRGQATNRYIHLPKQEPMAVVSAGSLCAGPSDLPTGVNRQYNVIEISDDCSHVRVHVREMAVATVFAPARRVEFGGESFVDMKLGRPLPPILPERAREDARIIESEQLLAAGEPRQALELLHDVALAPDSYARVLAIKAAVAAEDWEKAIALATPPCDITELVTLTNSLVSMKRFDDAIAALDEHGTNLGFEVASQGDIRSYVAAKRSLA